jgi:sialic acid synthase SpsE
MQTTIADRVVGDGAPCLVVAALGSNHDGSLARAVELVDLAADAGADAVSIPSFTAATLLARRRPSPAGGWQPVPAYTALERLTVPVDWYPSLRDRAHRHGMAFLAVPYDERRADFLAALGVSALRVASGDLTHLPLLRRLGGFGRPVLLGTRNATRMEIGSALDALAAGAGAPARRPPVVLVHGVGERPAAGADLPELPALRSAHQTLVGWSAHGESPALAVGAVALGAAVVERSLTDDPTRAGPDHATAVDPGGFRMMVAVVRELEAGLGTVPRPRGRTSAALLAARRSVYAARAIPAGTTLSAGDLKVVRPGLGLPPEALAALLGRRLRRPLAEDEPLTPEDCA